MTCNTHAGIGVEHGQHAGIGVEHGQHAGIPPCINEKQLCAEYPSVHRRGATLRREALPVRERGKDDAQSGPSPSTSGENINNTFFTFLQE